MRDSDKITRSGLKLGRKKQKIGWKDAVET